MTAKKINSNGTSQDPRSRTDGITGAYRRQLSIVNILGTLAVLLCLPVPTTAWRNAPVAAPVATPPPFIVTGAACPFAVLGASAVTGAASVVIGGFVGVSPGTAITTFPAYVAASLSNAASSAAAHSALDAAIIQAQGSTTTQTLSASAIDIGGQTLTSGVYKVGSSLTITGTLYLDAQGDPNAAWIFQIGSTLITAAASQVVITNPPGTGMAGDHVWWQVGSSATIGSTSTVLGTVMATASITTGAGSTTGSLLAKVGAVTLGAGANVGVRSGCFVVVSAPHQSGGGSSQSIGSDTTAVLTALAVSAALILLAAAAYYYYYRISGSKAFTGSNDLFFEVQEEDDTVAYTFEGLRSDPVITIE